MASEFVDSCAYPLLILIILPVSGLGLIENGCFPLLRPTKRNPLKQDGVGSAGRSTSKIKVGSPVTDSGGSRTLD